MPRCCPFRRDWAEAWEGERASLLEDGLANERVEERMERWKSGRVKNTDLLRTHRTDDSDVDKLENRQGEI